LVIRTTKLLATLLTVLTVPALAFAEGTKTWEQYKFDDLLKGTPKGVAIRSTGGLELSPALKPLATTSSTYLWAIAPDASGDLYAAAGSPARVYRITPSGQTTVVFEPLELQVQSILVTKTGALLAATAPDGKVYKIEHNPGKPAANIAKAASDSAWSSSVYFDPGAKYIWDLAEDPVGNLFVATGDHGEIYRVTPGGAHSLFFKSDEVHIRALAFDGKGNLIAGSDGSGLIYRISPDGSGFVLYSAPKREITALAVDAAGNIYAAAVGDKRSTGSAPTPAPLVIPSPASSGTIVVQPSNAPAASVPFPAPGAGISGGSEIYRIAPDGSPARIWSSRDDVVYALAFDPHGRLLAGTGNRGHIYAINGDDNYADLLRVAATQVTAFTRAPGGGLYVSSSNNGKIGVLGPAPETDGTYESDVFDAKTFSRWGRAEFRGQGNVELFARSGNVDNPDRNWSPWNKIDLARDAALAVPPARFVQWKAVLHAGSTPPRVESVLLNYLPRNVAPQIDDVTVQVGVRYVPGPKPSSDSSGSKFDPVVPSARDRDSIGVKWTAHDDNDDQMTYSVYYRGEGQTRWLLLREDVTDKYVSFDASLLPDGAYMLKVVASDAPSHSPGEALTTEKESPRFEVDTTPPRIEGLTAALEGERVHIAFRATDNFSPIKRAEYSVDADDWQLVEPVGQISDSKTESYDFKVKLPADADTPPDSKGSRPESKDKQAKPGDIEHVVVVRAYDRYDNMSSAKTVIPAN
jgi:hypothetical protein